MKLPREKTASEPGSGGADETITGLVDHIVYRSEETGYTVCVLKPAAGRKEVVVVGRCAALWAGETLTAEGGWTRHQVHGYQFEARRMTAVAPHSAAGIRRFLASGLIRGIGPVLAERLVIKFGTDTLRVIEHESARLESVPGIGRQRRERIKAAWNEQQAVRDVMIFLHGHGVGTAQALRIHRAYGAEAIARVRANPYRLAADIWGIGFKTADGLAQTMQIPRDSPIRARAGLVYTLQTMTDEGHCLAAREELLAAAERLLEIPAATLAPALAAELAAGAVIEDRGAIYLAALYHAENGIAAHLRRLLDAPARPLVADPARAVAWAAARMRLAFAPRQVQALIMALTSKVSIITGGPGVGKTTIIRALVDILDAKRRRVCLAAPTGRAAKRMEQATGRPAQTLHRLLKYKPGAGEFEHHQSRPLAGDVFVLDEVSMIDAPLMNACLRALPTGAILVLVGDADQLPSVGPGNVLRDCLASAAIPTLKLDTIFRQRQRSWIVHNAHRVNAGQPLEFPPPGGEQDFYFLEENEPDRVSTAAVELVTRRIPDRFGFNPRTEIQLLTPMRRFQLGSENMNAVLQAALNPVGPSLARFGRIFRAGDRVMQLRNNYDKDVFNGDIGCIRDLDPVEQTLEVDYDGRVVAYGLAELDELSLAYACSIHKAQGGEHPAVVILMTTQHYKLLQRNLLYTALTRARRLACLVGSRRAVDLAIRNDHVLLRRTRLRERLQAGVASSPQPCV